jgi:hypothetical protein
VVRVAVVTVKAVVARAPQMAQSIPVVVVELTIKTAGQVLLRYATLALNA